MISEDLLKRFKQMQQNDEARYQAAKRNMNKISEEALRVADVAHNSESILYYFLIKQFNYIGEYDIINLGDGYGIKIQV